MQSNADSEYGFVPNLPNFSYRRTRYKVTAITSVTTLVSRKAFLNVSRSTKKQMHC